MLPHRCNRKPVKNEAPGTTGTSGTPGTGSTDGFKDQFLSGDQSPRKSTFYNLVVASAFRIDVGAVGYRLHVPAESEEREEPVRRAEGVAAVDRREGRRDGPCRSRSSSLMPATAARVRRRRLAERLGSPAPEDIARRSEGGSDGEFDRAGRARDLPGRQDHDRGDS